MDDESANVGGQSPTEVDGGVGLVRPGPGICILRASQTNRILPQQPTRQISSTAFFESDQSRSLLKLHIHPAIEESDEKDRDSIIIDEMGVPTTAEPDSALPNGKHQHIHVKTPFSEPDPSAKPAPVPPLSPEQEAKYQQLLKTVSAWTKIPANSGRNAPQVDITDEDRMFLTRECLLRYLRAVKWNMIEAPKRLMATLVWRREYGVLERTADDLSVENETGKEVVLGYDNNTRPCLYMRPSKQNTQRSERQIQHLVFMLERTIDLMVPGQDTMVILIDFKDSSNTSNPSVAQGRQALTILQGHYPERLGRALITNVPWFVWTFFKLISPFIDPLTREKMKFNENLRDFVPPAQLWSTMGGDVDFDYDHSAYWPALNKLATERKREYRERWMRAGKQVGELEAYLKGGDQPSVTGFSMSTTEEAPPVEIKKVTDVIPNGVTTTETLPDIGGLKVES
ncbi:MAG: hypothetical protein M1823_004742 [Watsoniomyces obsoletus]|nr:MAG: hypothetical protein M1823_004742 [Watsoniomyces obsoletus]